MKKFNCGEMKQQTPVRIPRVAAVHDLSGLGRCSLTAAIPILSVMGLQCCPLPTAVLSNQTGFESYSYLDFTGSMPGYIAQWEGLGLSFDAIYTGFLGSTKQIDIVSGFISHFRQPGTLTVIDPVMGDNGRLYSSIPHSFISSMKRLIKQADIIVPNLTEAAFLTGLPEQPAPGDRAVIARMANLLAAQGPQRVIITGCVCGERVTNYVFDFSKKEEYEISAAYNQKSYSGTGDIFASILCGCLTRGDGLRSAVARAAAFVEKAAAYTLRAGGAQREGILFEPFLKELD